MASEAPGETTSRPGAPPARRDRCNCNGHAKAIVDASEREQQRIAHALHDGVCQELAGIAYLTHTLEQKLQRDGSLSKNALMDVAALVQQALRHGRALARTLHPVEHAPVELSIALQQLVSDVIDTTGARCRFTRRGQVEIYHRTTVINLYRIVQESVRSAIQANASLIVIAMTKRGSVVSVTISDNRRRQNQNIFENELVEHMIMHRAHQLGAKVSTLRCRDGTVVTCRFTNRKGA